MSCKATILLVEDEHVVALAETLALEQEGYAVRLASSGVHAVVQAQTEPLPDLILMDMNLGPGLDGGETAATILRQRDVPVVFLSSHTDRETVEHSRRITSYGYVVKGSGIPVLLAAVETALELFAARKAAQESRRLYRDTVLHAREGIVVYDRDLRYVVWNRFMEDLTGIPAQELLGHPALEVFPHLRSQGTDRLLARALEGETVDSGDTPFFVPETGRRGWVTGTYAPRRDSAERIVGVLATLTDITARKQAEDVLRQLAAIVESAQDAIVGETLEGAVTFWNRGAELLFGHAAETMRGQDLSILVPQERADEDQTLRKRIAAGEEIRHFETERRTHRGALRTVSLSVFPVRDASGHVTGMASIFRDMTEHRRLEASLRESETRFRAYFDRAPDAILITDAQGRCVDANPAACALTGYDAATLSRGLPLETLLCPEFIAASGGMEPWRKQMGALHLELPLRRKDGTLVWVALDDAPLEEGRFIGFLKDITPRRKAEDALEESRNNLQALLNAPDHIMALVDRGGRILDCNEALARHWGLSVESLRGKSIFQKQGEDVVSRRWKLLESCVREGIPKHLEDENRGHRFEIDLFPVPEDGFVTRVAVSVRDITERARSQDALRDAEERYRSLFENASDAIFIAAPNGPLLETNRAARDSLGYSAEELSRLSVADIAADTPPETVHEHLQIVLAQGQAVFETRHRRKDGTSFPVEVRGRHIVYRGASALMGFARDISDRIAAQQALERSIAEKQMFLRELRHRVKNTLATILSLLSMEERRAPNIETREAFRETASRVQTMATLYDTLQPSGERAEVDLGAYLTAVAQALFSSTLSSSRISLHCHSDPIFLDLRRSVACGLVVNELITNALKHAFPSERTGTVELMVANPEGHCEIRIADDGIGLLPEAEQGLEGTAGMQLTRLLAAQLDGTLDLSRHQGTAWTLRFLL